MTGRLARRCIQAIALAIFAYQMFEAGKKYFSFSSTPSVEIKDIVNAELPEIYVCRKDLNYMDKLDESEYASLSAFLAGKSIIYSPENVT